MTRYHKDDAKTSAVSADEVQRAEAHLLHPDIYTSLPLPLPLPLSPTLALTSPRLSVLDLKDSDECTDAGLIAVAGGCAKLQALARWIGRWMDR